MVLHLLGIEGGNGKRKTENLFEWEGKNGKVWHTPSASLCPASHWVVLPSEGTE